MTLQPRLQFEFVDPEYHCEPTCNCELSGLCVTLLGGITVEVISSVVVSRSIIIHTIRLTCQTDQVTRDITLDALNCGVVDCRELDFGDEFVGSCRIGLIKYGNDPYCCEPDTCSLTYAPTVCPKDWLNGDVYDTDVVFPPPCEWLGNNVEYNGTQYTLEVQPTWDAAVFRKTRGIDYSPIDGDRQVVIKSTSRTAEFNNGSFAPARITSVVEIRPYLFPPQPSAPGPYNRDVVIQHSTPAGFPNTLLTVRLNGLQVYSEDDVGQDVDSEIRWTLVEYLGTITDATGQSCLEQWDVRFEILINSVTVYDETRVEDYNQDAVSRMATMIEFREALDAGTLGSGVQYFNDFYYLENIQMTVTT